MFWEYIRKEYVSLLIVVLILLIGLVRYFLRTLGPPPGFKPRLMVDILQGPPPGFNPYRTPAAVSGDMPNDLTRHLQGPPPEFNPHRTPAAVSGDMPNDLTQHLLELEEWASINKADARRDTLAFWALKLPAIFASASAGVLAHFNLTTVSVIMGAIASVCVIVDGLHPRGMLRNTHLRAYHDLRILTSRMVSAWRARNVRSNPETTARNIIKDAESERQRIAAYVRDAETALNIKTEDAPSGSSGRG